VYAFFDTFAIVEATTQGGPGKETEILVFKVFNDGSPTAHREAETAKAHRG